MRAVRVTTWIGLGALVVLATRSLCYALVPSPEAQLLSRQAAGPALPTVVAGALFSALVVAALVVWLASMAVRERHLVSGEPGPAPALDPVRPLVSAGALFVATSLAFAALESYIHLRAGLGFHGLRCLIGPVHRNALPILAALSLLAAALDAAARHLIAWARRTIRLLTARPRAALRRPELPSAPRSFLLPARLSRGGCGARAPPPVAFA
jgi:hypothetical protein